MPKWIRALPLLLIGSTAIAGQAAKLVVNCIPSVGGPPSTTCYNETVGKPFTFWVIAVDSTSIGVATGYLGTVHITSADPTATLPADYTFKPADNGIAPFVLTFNSLTSNSVPSFEAVVAADTANAFSGTGGFYVFPAPAIRPTPVLGPFSIALLVVSILIFTALSRRGARY